MAVAPGMLGAHSSTTGGITGWAMSRRSNETIIKTITKGLRWLDRQIDMIAGPAQPGPVPAPAGLADSQVHRGSTVSECRCWTGIVRCCRIALPVTASR